MFRLTHRRATVLQGILWLLVGGMLVTMGCNFLVASLLAENQASGYLPLLRSLPVLDPELAALLVALAAIALGWLKGYYILAKTASKQLIRLAKLPSPIPYSQLFPIRYFCLLGLMGGLGLLLRSFPMDVRGGIDLAVGTALLFGSTLFFRRSSHPVKG